MQFRAPLRAGDVRRGHRDGHPAGPPQPRLAFEARVVCRAEPGRGPSAARVLDEPVTVVTATGTIVAPPPEA